MANIVRRGSEDRGAVAARLREWDPLRMMRDVFRWDPFAEMSPFVPEGGLTFVPQFDVKETKDTYIFQADLPGVNESDLEIALTGNRLTVSGKREAEERESDESYYTYERSYGSFTRAFTLPDGADADHVKANLSNGVLTLRIPKKPEMQSKKILLGGSEKAKTKA